MQLEGNALGLFSHPMRCRWRWRRLWPNRPATPPCEPCCRAPVPSQAETGTTTSWSRQAPPSPTTGTSALTTAAASWAWNYADGANCGFRPTCRPSDRAMFHADNAYRHPEHVEIESHRCRTNHLQSHTAFRGFGGRRRDRHRPSSATSRALGRGRAGRAAFTSTHPAVSRSATSPHQMIEDRRTTSCTICYQNWSSQTSAAAPGGCLPSMNSRKPRKRGLAPSRR